MEAADGIGDKALYAMRGSQLPNALPIRYLPRSIGDKRVSRIVIRPAATSHHERELRAWDRGCVQRLLPAVGIRRKRAPPVNHFFQEHLAAAPFW
jgi:hypothetical protein